MNKHDIVDISDIRLLVNTFYKRVQEDEIIGGIFRNVIKDWSAHLGKMYCFWQTVLLDESTYSGTPFLPHAHMPLTAIHFERWLDLWQNSVDEFFEGEKASEAKWRGDRMATLFLSKIQYLHDYPQKPLL